MDFFELIEKTSMTKSYKIPLLLSLFGNKMKKEVTLKEISNNFKVFYSEKLHEKDLIKIGLTAKQYEKLALDNPIKFITTSADDFFSFEDKKFKLNEELYNEIRDNSQIFQEIKIRIKYRSKNYFKRKYMEEEE
ncbi:MAG: hypothetical protein ACRC6K_03845 [Fusobacteriaceae bacterium]